MDKFTEKTLGCERKYTGKIVSVDLLDIELPDGRRAKRAGRAYEVKSITERTTNRCFSG